MLNLTHQTYLVYLQKQVHLPLKNLQQVDFQVVPFVLSLTLLDPCIAATAAAAAASILLSELLSSVVVVVVVVFSMPSEDNDDLLSLASFTI